MSEKMDKPHLEDAHAGHQHHPEEHEQHEHEQHEGHDQMKRQASHDASHQLAKENDRREHAGHEDHSGHVDHSDHELMFRDRFWVSLLLSLPVLLYSQVIQGWLGFSLPEFQGSQWITPILSVVIFFYGGLPFLNMAGPEIRNRKPGMMTLISLAISVSFLYSIAALLFDLGEGFFWELVTLIDVMLLGHWIEMRSVRQASGALNELATLMPDTAERIDTSGQPETVRVDQLHTGDLILVRPGASVPADGIVVEGESSVNQAMITGESKPVGKGIGDKVIGGTINGSGSLRLKVEATGDDTALAGIMRLVADAQASKSNTQVLADKAAGWLFYLAVLAALLTGVGWSLSIGLGLFTLQRVVTVLVIACPHALGLAVPLVVAISTSSAARNGILVRDRLALEAAREIDIVIFDKTGTLTKGEQGVVGIKVVDNVKEDDALGALAAVEGDSEHIIAKAIRESAKERGLTLPKVDEFQAIKGRGVSAVVNNKKVHVGGPRMLEQLNLNLPQPLAEFSEASGEKGQSVVYLIEEGEAQAAVALADVIRPESYTAIKSLSDMGVEVVMLTGDSQAAAQSVAEELGIERYFAEVLPEDKDQNVVQLQSLGKKVAMVGDGVNDAPALTRADVGIAIGGGTDVAIESAGIILVQSNPMGIVDIFKLSRASYAKMVQNLIWATGYNVIAIPLAAGVLFSSGILLSPAIGALFMSLSTVIVAINAQFLRRTQLGSPA